MRVFVLSEEESSVGDFVGGPEALEGDLLGEGDFVEVCGEKETCILAFSVQTGR